MINNKENVPAMCPCDSNKPYDTCCQPYLQLKCDAPTAEALMRSRYTAFVLLNEDYLRYTWHPDTCPKNIHLNKKTQWLGLKIISTEAGSEDENTGEVEFVARSKLDGKASRLHEKSQFSRPGNHWVYIDGNYPAKSGR